MYKNTFVWSSMANKQFEGICFVRYKKLKIIMIACDMMGTWKLISKSVDKENKKKKVNHTNSFNFSIYKILKKV